jgi:hypothetical protein
MKPPDGTTLKVVAPTHRCPPEGSNVMPCCGRSPYEVPLKHRITTDPRLVTCRPGHVVVDVTVTPPAPTEET